MPENSGAPLWAGLWGRQAWKAGGKTHQLWVDYQSGRVLTSSSPSRDVKEELDELRKRARARKKARALGLIEQAQGVWAKADRQVKQAAKAAKAKPAKGKPGKNGASPTAVVSKDAPEIQEGAKRLAGMLQEIQQLVGGCPVKTGCFVAGTGVWVVGGRVAIEALGLGDAVRTREGADWAGGPWGPGDEWRLRAVWLRLAKEGGGCVMVGLLREADWLGGAGVGGEVRLDLEEQGAVGRAVVEAVRPGPPLPARREGYAVVTGVFRHESAGVCDLRVEGEAGAIGVTAGHPLWSADRGAWVSAGLLRVGERLLGEDGGTPRVDGVGLRAGAEPVYNIEVEGHHCYRVGRQGLLVHNASAGDPKVVQIETAHPGIKVDLPATVGNTFRAVDCTRPNDFFIKADLNSGVLTFNVVTVRTASDRSTIRATEFFTAAMEWFGAGSVQEIHLRWVEVGALPGGVMLDTNFQTFLANYDPTTDNREAAARTTPSYRIVSASPWIFSAIESVTLDPSDPRRFARRRSGRQVTVVCKKGVIVVPTTPPIQQPPPPAGQGSNPGQQPPAAGQGSNPG